MPHRTAHTEDNCSAIDIILHMEQPGKIYNRGANQETENIPAVETVLKLEKMLSLGWKPETRFGAGIEKIVQCYREDPEWRKPVVENEQIDLHREKNNNGTHISHDVLDEFNR